MIFGVGIAEGVRVARGWNDPTLPDHFFQKLKPGYYPGDLGFDPLGLKPTNDAELREMQTKELQNGRLAMVRSTPARTALPPSTPTPLQPNTPTPLQPNTPTPLQPNTPTPLQPNTPPRREPPSLRRQPSVLTVACAVARSSPRLASWRRRPRPAPPGAPRSASPPTEMKERFHDVRLLSLSVSPELLQVDRLRQHEAVLSEML
jgi:hypothetical protein